MKLNRYKKLEEFVSYDGGITYQPTGLFVKGDIIDSGEYNNITDCETPAKIPETIYRWLKYNYEEKYVCEGRDKYYLEYQQVSYNGGLTWENTGEERKGNVAVYDSDDCKDNVDPDIPTQPIYRWTKQDPSQDNVICDGYKAYYKLIEEVSTDGGKTYTPTGKTMRGELYQENSVLCGYDECDLVEGDTRWVEVQNDYLCDGHNKTKKLQLEKVVNCQWVKQNEFSSGVIIETNSSDCGGEEHTEDWRVVDGEYICKEVDGNYEPAIPTDAYCVEYTNDSNDESYSYISVFFCTGYYYAGNVNYIWYGEELNLDDDVTDNISCIDTNEHNINNDIYYVAVHSHRKDTNVPITDNHLRKIKFINDINIDKLLIHTNDKDIDGARHIKFKFDNCYNLEEISGLHHLKFPPSHLISLYYAFYNCRKLKEIDLSMFDLSYVKHTSYTFYNCNSLERLIIPDLYIDSPTDFYVYKMFSGCDNLKYIKCCQNFKDICYSKNEDKLYVTGKIGLTKEQLDNITWDIV